MIETFQLYIDSAEAISFSLSLSLWKVFSNIELEFSSLHFKRVLFLVLCTLEVQDMSFMYLKTVLSYASLPLDLTNSAPPLIPHKKQGSHKYVHRT